MGVRLQSLFLQHTHYYTIVVCIKLGTSRKIKKDKKGTKKSQSASEESAKTFAQPEEITKVDRRTESQKKFDAIKRQREIDRIKKKALKSHKEKVEDLNQYLDTISEHYDVPKVSWTK
ncbi:hypothetical protein SARC_10876 [Sphaeroforma arctica JP610]|uniref:Protein FAM32A n=1 Tax=Sphaeroforma arctica JP610 TaxID=667725 RepID=A0A0L0FIR3_9EUKA|nr:hypothetical protein SARC_10876 [Sphaeroforma arctica JP610]KNC76635.1 hypothetical protein SARC_10876 [Sphaeroforma arctica JP610]|eukprot:XP_014150537.1 hypothetical protein SARC_10876 [Sphaeroforma arctica JP610]